MARSVAGPRGRRQEHGAAILAARRAGHPGRRPGRTVHEPVAAGARRRPWGAPACLRSLSSMNPDSRTLTKAELAELLFERVGLNKREAKDIVDTFFEEIRECLARGT